MAHEDADIRRLFGDHGGEVLPRWVDRLGPYLEKRTVIETHPAPADAGTPMAGARQPDGWLPRRPVPERY